MMIRIVLFGKAFIPMNAAVSRLVTVPRKPADPAVKRTFAIRFRGILILRSDYHNPV